ncbi:MAG: hypothetical protein IT344_02945 [Candidatus Dadabacteria bacterium]|nr:hypothetical protein [Candidatus Dadabacteria bacterium]
MKKFVKIVLVVLGSVIVSLAAAEGLSRLFLDPIDFLKPTRVYDPVLRYTIEPGTGAHDKWGFRNRAVPARAEIVAVGDSHTYGISATAEDSWPSALAEMRGATVYNMALGGYGPAEYFYLMADKAVRLAPGYVIVGFYLGNDLRDSFNAVYSVGLWERMRRPGFSAKDADDDDEPGESGAGLGEWLAGHSVFYRLVSSSFIGDNLRQMRRLRRGEEIVMFEDPASGIKTGFTPERRLQGLDLEDPEVREGLRLSLEFFSRMNMLLEGTSTKLLVVVIPTKESVYARYIEGDRSLPASEKIDRLVSNEREVNARVKEYFDAHGIAYVDVLDALGRKAGSEQLYPANFGGHTNGSGYRIIAETINAYLEKAE